MTLSDNPRLRLLTLCALYIAQGIPFGFVMVTLANILAEQGLGSGEIGGFLALATLPWAFKWLWGPVLDLFGTRVMGRRRPWILVAQGLMALTIGAMLAVPDLVGGIAALGWLVFTHNVFNSLQDVAVDALAVDLLEEDERGRVNGLMYGSKYLGVVIGSTGLAWVVEVAGLQVSLVTQLLMLTAIFLLPLWLRERPEDRFWGWQRAAGPADDVAVAGDGRRASPPLAALRELKRLFGDLARAFTLRSTVLGVGLALAAQLGNGVLSVVAKVLYTQRLGFDASTLSEHQGWAYLVGLFGAVGGGFLVDRLGARRVIAGGLLGLGGLWLAFALAEPYWHHKWLAIALLYAEPACGSVASVGMFALFMGISWPKVAATQFTAYMALLNLSSTWGHAIAGPLDEWLDFGSLYVIGAGLQVVAVLLLWWIDPQQTRRVLGSGSQAAALQAATGD